MAISRQNSSFRSPSDAVYKRASVVYMCARSDYMRVIGAVSRARNGVAGASFDDSRAIVARVREIETRARARASVASPNEFRSRAKLRRASLTRAA